MTMPVSTDEHTIIRRMTVALLFFIAIFLPRMVALDSFFIQDEQPWIDRSQIYTSALRHADFDAAARYPLSNHPAIPLMTTVGPVMKVYKEWHNLEGTYSAWNLDHKRQAAVWARFSWGVMCSVVLLVLYATLKRLSVMRENSWLPAVLVILFGLEPWIWGISRSVSVDVMMAIGLVLSFVTTAVARERKKYGWFFLAGAWWGIAFISKSPALIVLPILLGFVCILHPSEWRSSMKRLLVWLLGAYLTMVIVWPPFFFHPIQRLTDVLARAELHSTVLESYYWPGVHPPLFIYVLSTLAAVGCVIYLALRVLDRFRNLQTYALFDVMLIAGIFHGIVLIYLHGDHARKNIPVLGLLSIVGFFGILLLLKQLRINAPVAGILVIVFHLSLVGPYFPHIISSHNLLVSSEEGNRLLVDVGNGSRLIADYINSKPTMVAATAMDSLVQPYLHPERRSSLRGMPRAGSLSNLEKDVTHIVIPASFPARVTFDPDAVNLLKELSDVTPEIVLRMRDVTIASIYAIP